MKKLILPLTLLLSIVGVYFLTGSFKGNTTHFYGIADNQEQPVSFQESVKIIEISVIEGQFVEQGMILLRAERSSLMMQKNQLNSQIDGLSAQQNESKIKIDAEVSVLYAQERSDLARLDTQIAELRSKQQQNNALFKNILGHSPSTQNQINPLQIQINSLRKQRRLVSRSIQTQVDSLVAKSNASEKPISVRKKQVADSLEDINRQEDELTIKADFSGRIGSISHKRGERIASFQPVLTVYGLYPKMVKGYIHENVSNNVKIGQQVWIHSLSNNNKNVAIEGRVESLGSRIVEYPERLRKNSIVKSWGREVNVRLPMNNPLLLGEKVQVSFSSQRPNSAEAFFKPFGEKSKTLFPHSYVDRISDDSRRALPSSIEVLR